MTSIRILRQKIREFPSHRNAFGILIIWLSSKKIGLCWLYRAEPSVNWKSLLKEINKKAENQYFVRKNWETWGYAQDCKMLHFICMKPLKDSCLPRGSYTMKAQISTRLASTGALWRVLMHRLQILLCKGRTSIKEWKDCFDARSSPGKEQKATQVLLH